MCNSDGGYRWWFLKLKPKGLICTSGVDRKAQERPVMGGWVATMEQTTPKQQGQKRTTTTTTTSNSRPNSGRWADQQTKASREGS